MDMMQCDQQPRGARADARRQHLLDVARKLFIDNGFHQTGVAQIASVSGIKVGQIYRDFQSKEEIIAAITEADVTAWLEEDVLSRAVADSDLDAIRAWIRRFGKYEEPVSECRMMAEIIAESGRNERIAEIHQAVDLRMRNCLAAALVALAPGSDRSRDVPRVVELILAIGIGIMIRRVVHPKMNVADLGRHVAELLDQELDQLARGEPRRGTT